MLHQAYGVTYMEYVGDLRAADADVLLQALSDERADTKSGERVSAFAQPPDLTGL